MATPSEKLSIALDALKKLQDNRGIAVIKATDFSRTHKELLYQTGSFVKLCCVAASACKDRGPAICHVSLRPPVAEGA